MFVVVLPFCLLVLGLNKQGTVFTTKGEKSLLQLFSSLKNSVIRGRGLSPPVEKARSREIAGLKAGPFGQKCLLFDASAYDALYGKTCKAIQDTEISKSLVAKLEAFIGAYAPDDTPHVCETDREALQETYNDLEARFMASNQSLLVREFSDFISAGLRQFSLHYELVTRQQRQANLDYLKAFARLGEVLDKSVSSFKLSDDLVGEVLQANQNAHKIFKIVFESTSFNDRYREHLLDSLSDLTAALEESFGNRIKDKAIEVSQQLELENIRFLKRTSELNKQRKLRLAEYRFQGVQMIEGFLFLKKKVFLLIRLKRASMQAEFERVKKLYLGHIRSHR